MNDLRRVFPHQLWRYLGGGALGCLVHLQVMALDNMPTRLDKFNTWSNGNVVSTRYAHDAAVGAIKHAQRSSLSAVATTGGVNLTKQIALNTSNGVVTMTATQRMSAASIARALRPLAAHPVVGLALLAAPSVLDLFEDAGVNRGPDGQFTTFDPEICTQAPCLDYYPTQFPTWPLFNSLEASCKHYIATRSPPPSGTRIFVGVLTSPSLVCQHAVSTSPGAVTNTAFSSRPTAPRDPESLPLTDAEVEERLALANPSPEVLRDLVQIGDVVPEVDPADQTSISAPQPSPTKTSTTTMPDGSTDTTECRTVVAVVGQDVRLSEECTTTHRNPSGTITGTTTSTSDQADPESQPQEEEKSMFCELFPNVLACAEFGDPDGDEIPRGERSVSFSPEVLFGSGSCPADKTITAQGLTITVGQWSTWCPYITTYMRPIVLLLAAFAALMIVLKGVEE